MYINDLNLAGAVRELVSRLFPDREDMPGYNDLSVALMLLERRGDIHLSEFIMPWHIAQYEDGVVIEVNIDNTYYFTLVALAAHTRSYPRYKAQWLFDADDMSGRMKAESTLGELQAETFAYRYAPDRAGKGKQSVDWETEELLGEETRSLLEKIQ